MEGDRTALGEGAKVSGATIPEQQAPPTDVSLGRNRDYLLLLSGQIGSTLGSAVSGIAFPLLILALTGSPAQAGIAGALVTIPYVIFSLPAGALVDRLDRKRVMIICDAVRAINMGSIPVALALNALTVWQIYLVSLIEGSMFVFFNLAEVAALPRVVAKAQVPAAMGQNQASQSAAQLIGPALGGFLFGSVGRAVPFLADAISYAISVASLLLIKREFQLQRAAKSRNLRGEIVEGLRWMWKQSNIRFVAFITGAINFAFIGSFLAIIVLAQNMGASDVEVGAIFSIGSIGAVVGSLVASAIQKRFSYGQVITGSVVIQALVFPLYAVAPNVLVLGMISAVVFFLGPIYSVASVSYRLALIPDELQGRVNSSFRLIAFGFQPLGSAIGGFLLERIGGVSAVLVFSACMIATAIAVLLNRSLRQPDPAAAAA